MSKQSATRDENAGLFLSRKSLGNVLKQLRERKIEASFIEAANDPLYIQDLHDCMREFAEIDRDSLRYIDFEPESEI